MRRMLSNMPQIPQHIAIIPDGNRRWAQAQGLPSIKGHEKGFEAFRPVAERAFERGVKVLSGWGFSTENWKRAEEEIGYLMGMFAKLLQSESKRLHEKNIRLLVSGSRQRLEASLIEAIEEAQQLTKDNTKGIVNICLNYGGRQEIVDTVNTLLSRGLREVTTQDISANLYQQLPDVDLIIRTSGERRLSGFMPWQTTYSELYFTDIHWPDFTPQELDKALDDFQQRQRRFGK